MRCVALQCEVQFFSAAAMEATENPSRPSSPSGGGGSREKHIRANRAWSSPISLEYILLHFVVQFVNEPGFASCLVGMRVNGTEIVDGTVFFSSLLGFCVMRSELLQDAAFLCVGDI